MNCEGDLIAQCVTTCLEHYFADLGGEQPCGVYDMVMAQVEKPLLQKVLQECEGNQTRAAAVLGLAARPDLVREVFRQQVAYPQPGEVAAHTFVSIFLDGVVAPQEACHG